MTKSLIAKLKQNSMAALICYLSLAMLTGCSTFNIQVQDPTSPIQFPSVLAERIVLSVAIPPDEFKDDHPPGEALNDREKFQRSLVNSLERSLVSSGVARRVSFSSPEGSWTMSVVAKWDSRSAWHQKAVLPLKLFFVIVLLFIPLLFMTASYDVRTEAEATVIDPSGTERGRVSVQARVEAEISARRGSPEIIPAMYALSSDELTNRILLELKRHPHWFEPAR
jgi:hypothetical protein